MLRGNQVLEQGLILAYFIVISDSVTRVFAPLRHPLCDPSSVRLSLCGRFGAVWRL